MDENIDPLYKKNLNRETQKKMDEKLDDLLYKVEDSLKVSINKGIILGMKESLKSLNQFIDEKQKMGLPESISKFELNTFLEEYIRLIENRMDEEQEGTKILKEK